MNVLLLNGSPAEESHTGATLRYLNELFGEQGANTEVVDLKSAGLPINDPKFHADAMQSPDENVRNFAQKVKEAKLIVLGTPLYHGSFSGLLKSALDNLDGDAFTGKKVLLVSNSSGVRGAMQAAQELSIVPTTMSGEVHNRLIGTCKADFTESENGLELTEESIKNRCQQIAKELS